MFRLSTKAGLVWRPIWWISCIKFSKCAAIEFDIQKIQNQSQLYHMGNAFGRFGSTLGCSTYTGLTYLGFQGNIGKGNRYFLSNLTRLFGRKVFDCVEKELMSIEHKNGSIYKVLSPSSSSFLKDPTLSQFSGWNWSDIYLRSFQSRPLHSELIQRFVVGKAYCIVSYNNLNGNISNSMGLHPINVMKGCTRNL